MEEDIDMKNHFRNKSLPDLISIGEKPSKVYVDKNYNDAIIIKNNTHFDFNYKNFDSIRYLRVNSLPAVSQHVTPEQYVDDDIDEKLLVRRIKMIFLIALISLR